MNSNSRMDDPAVSRVLDVSTLGRPVHRLDAFADRLTKDLAEALRSGINRRYRAGFDLRALSFDQAAQAGKPIRWTAYAGAVGRILFAAERPLVLTLLGYRFGLFGRDGASAPAVDEIAGRETATEERVAAGLGEELIAVVAARIVAGDPERALDVVAPPAFVVAPAAPPAPGAWTLTCTVADPLLGEDCHMWFVLDDACMDRLLRGLAPPADRKDAARADTPFANRLQMTLTGRLLSKEIQLGELFDLRVGDVIPVFVGEADVLVDDSRLFTAAVAEQRGKLCLTSFNDMD